MYCRSMSHPLTQGPRGRGANFLDFLKKDANTGKKEKKMTKSIFARTSEAVEGFLQSGFYAFGKFVGEYRQIDLQSTF